MKNNFRKTQLALVALLVLVVTRVTAQPYGQSEYFNPNFSYLLSKGLYYQSGTPGFIMAGYRPITVANSPNYVVYRTSPGGGLSGASAWTHGFIVMDCQSNQVINCTDMNLIEANGNGFDFLAAMVNNDGLFVNGITSNGMPGAIQSMYPFPTGATNATKPHLLQLTNTDFLVCGSYTSGGTNYMYLVKFDANGVDLGGMLYSVPGGGSLVPNDIIESPFNHYGSDELAIVGTYNNGAHDIGFLLITDHIAYAPLMFSEFSNTAISNEKFGSIIAVGGSAGSYMIHGVTDNTTGNAYRPTCMSVKPDGITMNWSYYYSANNMLSFGDPKQIIERPNSYSSQDYFMGFTGDLANVQKIDASGAPFAIGTNSLNYNNYNSGGLSNNCQSISYNNTPGNDEGLHLYGNSATSRFFLVQAYFNLQTNPNSTGNPCNGNYESPVFTQSALPTASLSNNTTISSTGSLSSCGTAFLFTNESVIHNQICGGDNSDIAGNNLRKTAINQYENSPIRILQSITDSEIIIEGVSNFTYSILQPDGKIIASGPSTGSISAENLLAGIYLLKIQAQGTSHVQKIIITH